MTTIQLEERHAETARSTAPWALEKLPPFPMVATRLLAVLNKENPEISEVGRTIAADPVFATRVLQMANSPLFALERQIRTLSHAIIVLGLARVKAIAVTRALGDFVGSALKDKALRACWQHSLAGALIAAKLAHACKMNQDFAYVAALLRDIGRLALLVNFPESYANLLAVSQENAYDLMDVERDLFDIDHCEAGTWLMEKMPFPPEFVEVVARHHQASIPEPFRMVHLVRIADRLADALGFATWVAGEPPVFEQVLADLPAAARFRFEADPEELKAEITAKIQTWS